MSFVYNPQEDGCSMEDLRNQPGISPLNLTLGGFYNQKLRNLAEVSEQVWKLKCMIVHPPGKLYYSMSKEVVCI